MDKDITAVKLSLQQMAKEAIIGIFGDMDEDQMIAKMHTVIELAEKLRIKDLQICISYNDLLKAKKQFQLEDDEENE